MELFFIIIIAILVLFLLLQFIFTNEYWSCYCTDYRKIKAENPAFQKVYKYNIPSFSKDIRMWFIKEAEKHAEKNTWTTKRHKSYATTDIPVKDIDSIREYIFTNVKKDIYTKFEEISGIKANKFLPRDIFIVKYKDGEQVDLKRHQDGSTFTFTMLLNDPSEFEGGGTFFYNNQGLIKPTNDEVIIHSGLVYHEGRKITKGVRYLLVGFCYANDDCEKN